MLSTSMKKMAINIIYVIAVQLIKNKELLLSIDESSLEELDLIYYSAETTNTNIPEIYEQPNSITFRLSYSPEAKTFIQYKTSYNNSPTSSGKMISQNDFKKALCKLFFHMALHQIV